MTAKNDPSAIADAASAREPSIIVAHPMGSHQAPLGLAHPLSLLGGDAQRLGPQGITATLGIDHAIGVRSFVAEACLRQVRAGAAWYHHAPLALLGARGVGKGMIAHWIARNAGLPLFRMSVPASRRADQRRGGATDRPIPPFPVIAMATSLCANPVIVLELDEDLPLDAGIEADLASMIDPRRNARWIDHDMETIFDLSHVSWIVEVQSPLPSHGVTRAYEALSEMHAALPPVLVGIIEDAGSVLEIEAPSEREELRRLDVAIAVCSVSGLKVDSTTLARVHASLMELNQPSRDHLASADLIRHAQHALASLQSGGPL